MGERAHTPGPWRVEQDTTLIWGDCNPDDTTSYGMGYPIAECRVIPSASWAKGPKGHAEAEANARLIAAAPDMFEALKMAREAFVVSGSMPLSDADTLALIDAALAKAAPSRSSSVEG